MKRLRPRTTILGGAAIGLVAGVAAFGATSSTTAPTPVTKPASFTRPEPVSVAKPPPPLPARQAPCAKNQELKQGVCIVHVDHVVVRYKPAAPVQAMQSSSQSGAQSQSRSQSDAQSQSRSHSGSHSRSGSQSRSGTDSGNQPRAAENIRHSPEPQEPGHATEPRDPESPVEHADEHQSEDAQHAAGQTPEGEH